MLRERVQTEALRTYLFAYGLHYASVSLDQVAATFQLPDKKVTFCHPSLDPAFSPCPQWPSNTSSGQEGGAAIRSVAGAPRSCRDRVACRETSFQAAVPTGDILPTWFSAKPYVQNIAMGSSELGFPVCRCTAW